MEALNDHFIELSYSGLGSRVLLKGSMEVSGLSSLCADALDISICNYFGVAWNGDIKGGLCLMAASWPLGRRLLGG